MVSLPVALGGKCHAVVRVLGGSEIDGSILADLKQSVGGALDDGVLAGILITVREPSSEMLSEAESVGEGEAWRTRLPEDRHSVVARAVRTD